jgi:hypothetical protein
VDVMIGRSTTIFFVANVLGPLAFAAEDEPIRIEIRSSWAGLGSPGAKSTAISGRSGRYSAEGRRIDAKAVTALLDALDVPVVQQPSLDACGADATWLAQNYAEGLADVTHRKISGLSVKQLELFRSRFVGASSSQAAFKELFMGWHTDDYPELSVKVKYGEREYGVQSTSQHPFMLPWIGTDRPRGGYSCKISQAIAALLDKEFPNRSRLVLDTGFRWELAERIMGSIRHDWNLLDTENRIGADVAPVFARFTPVKSEISNVSSIDLDGDQSWNAELRCPEFPSNLVAGVSLRYHDKTLSGVDTLLTRVPQYATLVLSVPWLRKYMAERAQATVELRYVNGRSLSPKAFATLREDLQKHDRAVLVDAVSQHAMESAFVEINDGSGCWSRSIVLPTREVLVWHFQCDSVLGFAATKFTTWDCYGWRCVGALIGQDGTIVK